MVMLTCKCSTFSLSILHRHKPAKGNQCYEIFTIEKAAKQFNIITKIKLVLNVCKKSFYQDRMLFLLFSAYYALHVIDLSISGFYFIRFKTYRLKKKTHIIASVCRITGGKQFVFTGSIMKRYPACYNDGRIAICQS